MLKTEIIDPCAVTVVQVTLKRQDVYISLVVSSQQKPIDGTQEAKNKKSKYSSSEERKRTNTNETIRKQQNNNEPFLTNITLNINGLNPLINMCIGTE